MNTMAILPDIGIEGLSYKWAFLEIYLDILNTEAWSMRIMNIKIIGRVYLIILKLLYLLRMCICMTT